MCVCVCVTSEIEQMSPKFSRYPQPDFIFCLPTFRTLVIEMRVNLLSLAIISAHQQGKQRVLPLLSSNVRDMLHFLPGLRQDLTSFPFVLI